MTFVTTESIRSIRTPFDLQPRFTAKAPITRWELCARRASLWVGRVAPFFPLACGFLPQSRTKC